MSEQPGPYGNVPPVPPLITRVDRLERDLAQITDTQRQNTNAISALINAIDGLRASIDIRLTAVDGRLTAMEKQLAALNQSNQLLAELITTRLPPTKE
jgi:hypothetical protein